MYRCVLYMWSLFVCKICLVFGVWRWGGGGTVCIDVDEKWEDIKAIIRPGSLYGVEDDRDLEPLAWGEGRNSGKGR